jgi:hypothetical protein
MGESFELLTQLLKLQLNVKLPINIDEEKLLSDFQNVASRFSGKLHSVKEHHDGGWKSIGLITSGGEVNEDRHINKVGKPYLPTPAWEFCPYIKEFLNELPAKKKRVRFLSLEPNHEIKWHFDGTGSIDRIVNSTSSRFHIPVITNPKIEFQICHNICQWKSAEMYYGDFSFPHRVKNNWNKKRIHLVIDLVPNDNLRLLFPPQFLQEEHKRFIARKLCKKLYSRYCQKVQRSLAQK